MVASSLCENWYLAHCLGTSLSGLTLLEVEMAGAVGKMWLCNSLAIQKRRVQPQLWNKLLSPMHSCGTCKCGTHKSNTWEQNICKKEGEMKNSALDTVSWFPDTPRTPQKMEFSLKACYSPCIAKLVGCRIMRYKKTVHMNENDKIISSGNCLTRCLEHICTLSNLLNKAIWINIAALSVALLKSSEIRLVSCSISRWWMRNER